MAEVKTKPNSGSVEDFIAAVADEQRRDDATKLLKLLKQVTKEEPVLWGTSIVGFGNYRYKSPSTSREGDWFITGFSPRKQNLTLYIMAGFSGYKALLDKLGKHKISGGSCLYINKLKETDEKVLKELLTQSFKDMKQKIKKQNK